MIPPWDRLQDLLDGAWGGSAADVRNAVAGLDPDQKAAIRDDAAMVARILERSGDAAERYRVIEHLELELPWAIRWLDTQRLLPGLTPHQWAQLLSEATRADHDALVAWPEVWALAQAHCPASLLQVTRQNRDPATAAAAFDDPVQIDTLFATLGPAGFLATATRAVDDVDADAVDAVYRKVQAKAKVLPTIEGLEKGARMGAATRAHLRAWFFTPSSTEAERTRMLEQRFRIQLAGGGAPEDAAGGTRPAHLPPLSRQGLAQVWTVCEALPPSYVEDDPRLRDLLRDQRNAPGDAYHAGPGTGDQGDILIGHRDGGQPGQGGGGGEGEGEGEGDEVYQAGGPGPGAPPVGLPALTAVLRAEIGRAVDASGAAAAGAAAADGTRRSAFVPAVIACRCGERYPAEVARGLHVSLRPELRRQILAGTFHRCFCPACGMTTMIEKLIVLTDVARRQWLTVAPSAGLPWREQWLAVARASFAPAAVGSDAAAPEAVAGPARPMTRRLLFGLAPLREQLIASDAGLDDRVVELLKIQLLRDLGDRLSAGDYFHLVAVTAAQLVLERTHPDGLIRKVPVPRSLYDALAAHPALPRLIELAFPDGLLIDHRAMLVPEAVLTR